MLSSPCPLSPYLHPDTCQSFFGIGGISLKVSIELNANTKSKTGGVVRLDHLPTWKVRKNVFSSLRLPSTRGGSRVASYDSGAVFAYDASTDIEGQVSLYLPQGKKVDHLGINVEFLGRITMHHHTNEGRPHYDFISLVKELSPPRVALPSQDRPALPLSQC